MYLSKLLPSFLSFSSNHSVNGIPPHIMNATNTKYAEIDVIKIDKQKSIFLLLLSSS